jgi:hypothetical protein
MPLDPIPPVEDILVDTTDVPKPEFRIFCQTLSDIASGAEVSIFRFVDPTWHAAIRDFTSTEDVSDALREAQEALSDLGPGADKGGRLYIPYGLYNASDYETDGGGNYVATFRRRVHIRGDGKHASVFAFNPAATASLFRFRHDDAVCYQASLRGIGFTGAGTQKKTAIEAYDTSELTLEDFAIYPWTGGTSRGIWLRAREITRINDYSINADQPIQVSANPNGGIVGCDHLTIGTGLLMPSSTNHALLIDSNVPTTNLKWCGQTAVVGGAGILKWHDVAYAGVHLNIRIENVRAEGQTAGGYLFDLQPNVGIQNLKFDNIFGGDGVNGWFLRKCSDVRWDGTQYIGTGTALNADGTVARMSGDDTFWQAGSTVTLAGQRLLFATPKSPATGALPPHFVYDLEANTTHDLIVGGGLSEPTITLANSAVAGIGPTGTAGMLTVIDSEGRVGEFYLKGTNNAVAEVSDVDGVFTAAAAGASSTNVYWSAGNSRYEIQNLRGAERRYKILLRGTYITF